MKRKHASVEFERLAFVSAIREHPGERAHQLAYTDWLHEIGGYTSIGAKRIVAKLVREATDDWLLQRVATWLAVGDIHAIIVAHRIRYYLVGSLPPNAEIVIFANGDKPFTIDRLSSAGNPDLIVKSEFNSGLPWSVLSQATDIKRSVGVGVRWVLRLCEDAGIHVPGLADSGGPYA